MNITAARPSIRKTFTRVQVRSGTVYALIIIMAMFAFEIFNYSTTAFSLRDLLGDLRFAGVSWATFLALAFCGIDFAGIARLINPENRKNDLKESWFLFGAWLIAATANAALTWWGVAVAINSHSLQSSAVISISTLTRIVPVFVAILVWVLRILIIASLTSAFERLTSKNGSSAGLRDLVSSRAATAAPVTMTRMAQSTRLTRTNPSFFEFTSRDDSRQVERPKTSSRQF
jgi:hypothetical protein